MKTDIHPDYKTVTFGCACGAKFTAGSTLSNESFSTEICSKCHPFYTGKQKLIDSSGRVDKFMAKMKKAQEHKEQQVKKMDEEITEEVEEMEKEEEATATPETEEIAKKEKN